MAAAATANIDKCDAAWTAGTGDVTCSQGTAVNEGTNSAQMAIAAGFTTGLAAYKAMASADFSAYQKISFMIYASAAVAANSLRIDLCSDNAGASAVDSFTLDRALYAGKRHAFTINKGSALGSSIQSVALTVLSDVGAVTIRLDNILACNSLHLTSVIGQSGGPYYPIRNIDGTTVRMGVGVNYGGWTNFNYGRATATVTGYARECAVTEANSNSNYGLFQDSGTGDADAARIRFMGGYNTSSGSVDGETWIFPECNGDIDGGFSARGFDLNGCDWITVDRLCPAGFDVGWYIYDTSSIGVTFGTINMACCNPMVMSQAWRALHWMRWTGTWKWTYSVSGGLTIGSLTYQDGGLVGDVNLTLYPAITYVGNGCTFTGNGINLTGKISLEAFAKANDAAGFLLRGCKDSYFGELEAKRVGSALNLNSCHFVHIGKLTVDDVNYLANFTGDAGQIRVENLVVTSGNPGDATWTALGGSGIYGGFQDLISFDRYKADLRYKSVGRYGKISDHFTGGEAADWAYGGAGQSLYLDPNNVSVPLVYQFFIPVGTTANQKLHMQVRKSASAADCALKVSIVGAGITPVLEATVTLTDSWAEFQSAAFTPTFSGFVRVTLMAYDGATTGNIGIDDIHIGA
jgi:hypothetical protein